MAKLHVSCCESRFHWVIAKFSDEFRKLSPEFELQGFPFQLELRKIRTIQDSTLKIYLSRINDVKNVELTCMVSAEYKLLSFDKNTEPHRKVLAATEYGAENSSMIGVSLISLNEINNSAKNFVQNDSIVLEIRVKADPPQTVFPSDLARLQIIWNERSTIKVNLMVKDFDKMVGIPSPIFSLCKIRWQLCVYRNDDTLDISLRPIRKDSLKCVHIVTIVIKLLSFSTTPNSHERKFSGNIDGNDIGLVFKNIIQWDELLKPENQFIRAGSIKLDIVIEANAAHQSVPSSQRLNENGISCPICLESLLDVSAVSLKCGHIFCTECCNSIKSKKLCPICRSKFVNSQIRPAFLPYAP